jgi:hypothetical protein
MRIGLLVCILMTALGSLRSTARAACPESRRYLVSQPPEVIFTAGVPETKYVPVIWLNVYAANNADCGAMASTTLSGITMQKNYCDWSPDNPGAPDPCPFENPAWVASDSGGQANFTYQYYWEDHWRKIAVHYDGSAPAGTKGKIDLHEAVVYMSDPPSPGLYLGSIPISIESGSSTSDWFTVSSSSSNVVGDSLVIDHPRTNSVPYGPSSVRVFVTHVYNGTNWARQVAATYDLELGKWKIRNEDGTSMPVGLYFHVHVDTIARRLQTASFSASSSLRIDDVRSNNNPRATIIVTPNTTGSRRLLHPIQVSYSAPYWYIQTSNGQTMPTSDVFGNTIGFFVEIISASRYMDDLQFGDAGGITGGIDASNGAGVDIRAVPPRKSANYKILNKFCFTTATTSPLGRPIIITKNQTPLGWYTSQATTNNFWGTWRVGSVLNGYTSTIYNESGDTMPDVVGFNVWGPYTAGCPPVYP